MILLISISLADCKKETKEVIVPTVCNCHIETAKDTYIYLIRPGSNEWNSFESSDQMLAATQISFAILDVISTMGLIETCFENPLFLDLYLVDIPQSFFDYYSSTFNVCQSLMSRKDALQKLIERYAVMCPECSNDNNYSNFGGKGGKVNFSFDAIELFLAQKVFLEKATKSQRSELADLVLEKYQLKKSSSKFSLAHQIYSVWVAGRIMEYDSFPEMLNLLKNKKEISVFIKSGTILLPSNSNITVDEIITIVMNAFKNYKSQKS